MKAIGTITGIITDTTDRIRKKGKAQQIDLWELSRLEAGQAKELL